jgi:hypothetical protein
MSNSLCSQLRRAGLLSLLTLHGILLCTSACAACYSTPQIAADTVATGHLSTQALKSDGYRVAKVQLDRVLGNRWVMIASCGHPEWPAFALVTNNADLPVPPQEATNPLAEKTQQRPAVRAGEIVRVWRQGTLLRIEATGVSEESGGLGKTVRVRLLSRNTDDQSVSELSGIVRGPSDVEIQP